LAGSAENSTQQKSSVAALLKNLSFSDQHDSNPTRFVLISKHEVSPLVQGNMTDKD
jgi:hypothetical protein